SERVLEPRYVDGVTALTCHELSEIDGKAVRIVELECILAGDRSLLRGLRWCELVEALHSTVDRREETLFFRVRGVDYVLPALLQLRIHVAHHVYHALDHRCERRLASAQEPRVAHTAPQDAAQHVTAPVVRRVYTVGQQKRDRARMIRDDAHGGDAVG